MHTATVIRGFVRAAFAAGFALASCVALAQTWPAKAITIVSPYPAGGITDLLSRIVAEEYAKVFRQPVVVENRTGAGGAIALAAVAKAAPDGYTLVMGGSAPSVIVPALNRNVTYGPKDFDAIGYVAGLPIVLVAHPSIPAQNLGEFVAYVRANGSRLNCGHHGVGTGTHLACVQFARVTGTAIPDVGYKGAPQVNADLLANRVQLYFGTLPTQIAFVRANQMRAYGVASAERAPGAPEIPTLDEQGLKGLNLDTWNALYAPAGTPKPVVHRLSAELVKILNVPEVRRRIEATGSVVRPGTADALAKLTADEFASYRRLAAETGIRLE